MKQILRKHGQESRGQECPAHQPSMHLHWSRHLQWGRHSCLLDQSDITAIRFADGNLRPTSRAGARRGQALVEFALVLPIFVLLLMIIVDFGRAVWDYNAVSNMSREGSRYAIINSHTDGQILSHVQRLAPDAGFQLSCDSSVAKRVCISPSPARTPNDPVTVTIGYRFVPITPMIAGLISGNGYIDIKASSTMTVEY